MLWVDWIGWIGWGGLAAGAINLWMLILNVLERRRWKRLNAALEAICVNAYLMRDWPVAPAVGIVLTARPMTRAEWLQVTADR